MNAKENKKRQVKRRISNEEQREKEIQRRTYEQTETMSLTKKSEQQRIPVGRVDKSRLTWFFSNAKVIIKITFR